jgi:hypothetical protein
MRRKAIWSTLILAGFAASAASHVEPRLIQPRVIRESPPLLELQITSEFRDRWVRLRNHWGRVLVNGAAVPLRPADRVTSSIALSPYLRVGQVNRIEADGFTQEGPRIELLPRVFLAGAAAAGGRLRILIENTLDNAANVEVHVPGAGDRDAYVPPDSQFEVLFSSIPDPSAEIRMTKFPEAIEEGYSTSARLSSLATIQLRESPNGAMVLGREAKPPSFHILERPLGSARPNRGNRLVRSE